MKDIVLIGGGGHCKSCIQIIEDNNDYRIVGILDLPETAGTKIMGYEVIGTDSNIGAYEATTEYLVTVGQIKSATLRHELFGLLLAKSAKSATIFAKSAVVSMHARVGNGTIVMNHTLVNSESIIGVNCIVNNFANIEHDVVIGDHCHISTGAMVNGNVTTGNQVFVGSGAVIANGRTICDRAVIGAGSVVIQDLDTPGVYSGNPARLIRPL